MIKNIVHSLSAFLLLSIINVAIASGVPFFGIGAGYNQLCFPETTQMTDFIVSDDQSGIVIIPNGNTVQTRSDHSFATAYGGYLFSVTNVIKIGPELGYTRYGSIRFDNLRFPGAVVDTQSGRIKVNFNSADFYLITHFILSHFFIQSKLGTTYMVGRATSDYAINNLTGTPFILKGVKNSREFLFVAGAAIGFYFTKHASIAFNYARIFAKQYRNVDLTETGNYTVFSKFRAPSMNLYGMSLTFYIS